MSQKEEPYERIFKCYRETIPNSGEGLRGAIQADSLPSYLKTFKDVELR
jgi:hypothetical protein